MQQMSFLEKVKQARLELSKYFNYENKIKIRECIASYLKAHENYNIEYFSRKNENTIYVEHIMTIQRHFDLDTSCWKIISNNSNRSVAIVWCEEEEVEREIRASLTHELFGMAKEYFLGMNVIPDVNAVKVLMPPV